MSEKQKPIPKASGKELDTLYRATIKLFERRRDITIVDPSPLPGFLRESIEAKGDDGRTTRVYRDRLPYSDSPTKVARTTPLSTTDRRGNNTYHTPVNIEVSDVSGKTLNDFAVTASAVVDGIRLPAIGDDLYAPDDDPDEQWMSRLETKELTARLDYLATTALHSGSDH